MLCLRCGQRRNLERRRYAYGGVKKLLKQYASTLVEGLVIAMAFALVDQLRSEAMTVVMAGIAGLAVGTFLGMGIAERHNEPDAQA